MSDLTPAERKRTEREVAELVSPQGIEALLRRIVETAAPIAEDGGSDEQLEAFNEVFADTCFVVHWLDQVHVGDWFRHKDRDRYVKARKVLEIDYHDSSGGSEILMARTDIGWVACDWLLSDCVRVWGDDE